LYERSKSSPPNGVRGFLFIQYFGVYLEPQKAHKVSLRVENAADLADASRFGAYLKPVAWASAYQRAISRSVMTLRKGNETALAAWRFAGVRPILLFADGRLDVLVFAKRAGVARVRTIVLVH